MVATIPCVAYIQLRKVQYSASELCLKAKLPISATFHCSSDCFYNEWAHHLFLHEHATKERRNEGDCTGSSPIFSSSQSSTSFASSSTQPRPDVHWDSKTWLEIGHSRTYTPSAEDIYHVLKLEVMTMNAQSKRQMGCGCYILSSCVIPAPSPTPRNIISVDDPDIRNSGNSSFSVLSYNILSESAATNDLYGYCPSWALSWNYRRQNLLSEIVKYQADIICLQKVQKDHFEDFFSPELKRRGYEALFMSNSTEEFRVDDNTVEGCATFFRENRFSRVNMFQFEFKKAAWLWTNVNIPNAEKRDVMARLMKDNVALILVLEAMVGQGSDNTRKGPYLCVANVNISAEPQDVKLWQILTLLIVLEKVGDASVSLPMVVCGDFKSLPGSAAHQLLAMGMVDPQHGELTFDPLGILARASTLQHHLALESAYSSFVRSVPGLEQNKKRLDPTTSKWLTVEGLLELLDKDIVKKYRGLPSPVWSSDHIAFTCKIPLHT